MIGYPCELPLVLICCNAHKCVILHEYRLKIMLGLVLQGIICSKKHMGMAAAADVSICDFSIK